MGGQPVGGSVEQSALSITVTSTARTTGFRTNHVGVVSSTNDPHHANNMASATVLIRPKRLPPGRGW